MTVPDRKPLSSFEGSDVVASKIEIPDAAGGLRDALAVDPVELHLGDEGVVALRYRVEKVRFDPTKGKRAVEGELVRVHVFSTLEAMFMDDAELDERLRHNALKVKVELEKLAGVLHLDDDLDDGEPVVDAAAMVKFHEEGLHHGVAVVGCPACAEREADRKADKPKARKDLA